MMKWAVLCGVLVMTSPLPVVAASPSMADILTNSPPSDWRRLDPENTVYLQLAKGRVVIELAPRFAPRHVANIKTLIREGYFDGLAIVRVQDNYVVQWADPDHTRPLGGAAPTLKAEFDRSLEPAEPFTVLPDADTYAPKTGFADGFPAARDPTAGKTWLTHCYGMVGVGRDNAADSGDGSELYAVIGQAPRQLDRNVTLVGRVVEGIDFLSSLPRGTETLGFYKTPAEQVRILSVRMADSIQPEQREPLEALRTDSATFAKLLQNRRFRKDDWYKVPAGRIDVCNMPLPVREATARK